MTRAARDILTAALTLPERERLELASEIIASVDGPADADWADAWLTELEHRSRAAVVRGEEAADWADVRARILARLATH
jgi:hypothetical protein